MEMELFKMKLFMLVMTLTGMCLDYEKIEVRHFVAKLMGVLVQNDTTSSGTDLRSYLFNYKNFSLLTRAKESFILKEDLMDNSLSILAINLAS